MNEALRAVNLLACRWVCVNAFDRYRDVITDCDDPARVFIVFDDARQFSGLVEERQAALFPGRIFADLVVRRPPPAVAANSPVEEVLQVLDSTNSEYIPVLGEGGELVGVTSRLSVFDSLIERFQAELNERRIASAVFAATSEGIMVTDERQRIVSINRAFTETTGYSLEEVLGKTPAILASGQHDEDFYRAMHQVLATEGSWEGEIWNRRKNGEVYPEWLHINAIYGSDGEIHHYAGVFSDITKHREMRERLHHLAYHDALTNLPNRTLFLDRVKQTIAQAGRGGSGFSVLFIDLDSFKDVNDTLGHSHGDRVLVVVAERLLKCMRESDTVARLGGDEFTVILDHGHEVQTAIAATEKILKLLSEPIEVDQQTLFFSASIGISRYPEDGQSAEALLMAADTAMYRAKEDGKGCFRFHSAAMHERVVSRMALGSELRQTLQENGLSIVWQPQVSLRTGQLTGMEALTRWNRADGTSVSPDEFIPLAEQTGLITALGNWVIEAAITEAAYLLQHCSGDGVRFAINISPQQVGSATSAHIRETLAKAGLQAQSLEVELTESSLSIGRDNIERLLYELGADGVQVAVDDFGTGCSNIATIKQLPIHRLKLDRSFVSELPSDTTDQEIAVAIIAMSHALGLEVIAEGVETQEQIDFLSEAGCDHMQGFLCARPMPKEELLSWLKSYNALP